LLHWEAMRTRFGSLSLRGMMLNPIGDHITAAVDLHNGHDVLIIPMRLMGHEGTNDASSTFLRSEPDACSCVAAQLVAVIIGVGFEGTKEGR